MLVNFNYIICILILIIGLYITITSNNLLKKIIGLTIFQAAIMLFFVMMGKILEGTVPILKCLDSSHCPETYSHPLPHVLMLTAIVVSIATLAVALSLIWLIKEKFNTLDEQIIYQKIDQEQ